MDTPRNQEKTKADNSGEVLDTPPNHQKKITTIPERSWTGGGGVSKESVRIVFLFFGFIVYFWYPAFCQRTAVEMSLAIHLSRSLKKYKNAPPDHWKLIFLKCTSRACRSVLKCFNASKINHEYFGILSLTQWWLTQLTQPNLLGKLGSLLVWVGKAWGLRILWWVLGEA